MASPTPANPEPLPAVASPLSPDDALARLATASTRGKLPGFQRGPGGVQPLCTLDAFGTPFDGALALYADTANAGLGCTLRPDVRLKPLMPAVFAAVLILSIWPGVVLTESLVASFIPGDFWKWTWWWYLPLTIPTAPWAMWVALKRSRASVDASAREQLAKVAELIAPAAKT